MIDFFDILSNFFYYGLLIYSLSLISCYLILALISIRESVLYMRKNSFVDYKSIANSPLAPTISVIAPAYNEGRTIIENVRSLISIRYTNYEVIIVNDGSKDDSLSKLISAYELELCEIKMIEQLKTKPVKGIYRSVNPAYSKITLVINI